MAELERSARALGEQLEKTGEDGDLLLEIRGELKEKDAEFRPKRGRRLTE